MSTGKRLAKRSILGTRVCAPNDQGLFVPGVIQASRTDDHRNLYNVCLDDGKTIREYGPADLVGPGFRTVSDVILQRGQRVFVTHNGREVRGVVSDHRPDTDEVELSLPSAGLVLRKRLEEIRLIESRKSARLQDSDTDYSRLADGQPEPRRRASSLSIDVPYGLSGRKRRSSADDGVMDDCMAAMVLMSLSCSPKSPCLPSAHGWSPPMQLAASSSSGASSWCSGGGGSTRATPSPPMDPLHGQTDEGIDSDASSSLAADDAAFPAPPKRKSPPRTRMLVFQCTWPGCGLQYQDCEQVERHVRTQHLKRSVDESSSSPDSEGDGEGIASDHEEEFYYTEMEVEESDNSIQHFFQWPGTSIYSSSVPTLSHLDMARPAHEDPEYRKQHAAATQVLSPPLMQASPISIPQLQKPAAWHLHGYAASAPSNMGSPQKCMRLSVKPTSSPSKGSSPLHRRTRSESRKCRKVYGMDNRDMWCTQCKWKKACTRFVD
ncbi:LOW QUALITY PROTEIN: zinc finger protein 395-like [Uloborus diversus]|uniref:LOW QUALITY PROTEIN: zinc finger protein 395-like n=1 Tax=Uloborus diversus TaxID=327109 RepID=UPI0024097A8D|nr:LOW QUALITY PROTEIN: zinc finger protein 395-like [Uloborus diversus]